jgi:hypothetical protein
VVSFGVVEILAAEVNNGVLFAGGKISNLFLKTMKRQI